MIADLSHHLALLSLALGGHGDKLKSIVDAHAASVAAVRTLSCTFTFTDSARGRSNGLYRRSGADFILKVTRADGSTTSTSTAGGQTKVLTRQNGRGAKPPQGLVLVDDGSTPNECDPYTYNLFHFYGQLKYRCELAEILAQPCTCRYVGPVERAGRPLERVHLSHARADLTIDFDPAVNYLARVVGLRSKLIDEAGKPVPEQEVTEFAEVAPGVYYPTKVRCLDPATGGPGWSIEHTDIQVNQPIPTESLALKFPPRIKVLDKQRGGAFMTDAAGEPTRPAIDKNGRPLLLATGDDPAIRPDDPEMPARPSRSEAGSLTRWVLPAALALLGTGVVLAVVRQARQGRSG